MFISEWAQGKSPEENLGRWLSTSHALRTVPNRTFNRGAQLQPNIWGRSTKTSSQISSDGQGSQFFIGCAIAWNKGYVLRSKKGEINDLGKLVEIQITGRRKSIGITTPVAGTLLPEWFQSGQAPFSSHQHPDYIVLAGAPHTLLVGLTTAARCRRCRQDFLLYPELCHLAAEQANLSLCQMKVPLKFRSWCSKGLISFANDSLVCADMTFESMTLGYQQLGSPDSGNYCFRWSWWHVNSILIVCSISTWPWYVSISPVGTYSPSESRQLLSGCPGYLISTVCLIA